MNNRFRFAILLVTCAALGVTAQSSTNSFQQPAAGPSPRLVPPERGFISVEEAKTWEQGLLSGNGTIGASVISRPLDETIVFSHKHLFMPEHATLLPPATATRLFEIRSLIDRGLYRQASQLAADISEQKGFRYPDPLMPAFDMRIQMEGKGDVTDYARSVNFETGEATVHWADARGVFERRLFVSRADGIAVLLIDGPGKGAVTCRLELQPRGPEDKRFKEDIESFKATAAGSTLTYRSNFAKAYPGSVSACEGAARVVTVNGSAAADGNAVAVRDADRVLVFVDIQMVDDRDQSRLGEMQKRLAGLAADYDQLLERHRRIHGDLFSRARLDLGGGADRQLTSEQLLAAAKDGRLPTALLEKEFDAGRYNIISSTSDLPPTLQGVWTGTYSPPWSSDFTHNGNVPSAIASLLMGNTPELMLAYTSYMESLVPYLEVNAQRIFGARGIVLPSRSTTNGYNNSFAASFPGAFWVAGAPWASHFFYDYYLYTGDREFLREHALPFMEKSALFFEDYLYEGPDGKLVFNPCQSPENTPGNTNSQASFNATMDVAAAKELLRNVIAASADLGVNAKKIPVWQRMLAKMPDYLVNDDGAVKEWLTPKLLDNYNHRHSSQLYALFDGMPEEIAESPRLRAAFKRTIELKLERHWANSLKKNAFMSFGLVQLGQAATSLGDGDLAYRCLLPLATRYWYHNLASTHNGDALFNTDISGGMPAVIIKMLAASEPGEIQLLPALPKEWPAGAIDGVLCRGQVEIRRLRWEPGRIEVTLRSGKQQQVRITTASPIERAVVGAGNASLLPTGENTSRRLSMPRGNDITLEITLKRQAGGRT
jgi:alpha-L-fucosidase 2